MVDWLKHRRLLEPIGNVPPAKAEKQYYPPADTIDMQSNSQPMTSGKPGAVQAISLIIFASRDVPHRW